MLCLYEQTYIYIYIYILSIIISDWYVQKEKNHESSMCRMFTLLLYYCYYFFTYTLSGRPGVTLMMIE